MDYIVALLGLAVVHLLAVASPGPSTVLVVQTAAVAGRRGGLMAALAMMLGALAWATAALFGLQALFARFDWLYLAFRIGGAIYLCLSRDPCCGATRAIRCRKSRPARARA